MIIRGFRHLIKIILIITIIIIIHSSYSHIVLTYACITTVITSKR